MKKIRLLVLTVLATILLVPNIAEAASTPSVKLTPDKLIDKGVEVTLEVNYGSEVESMYFDVESMGFCTLFDCSKITRNDITIDGHVISDRKQVNISRGTNRELQIGITAIGDTTKFTTVQVKAKAMSRVTRTSIKVSNIKSVSLPAAPGKSASVDVIDEYTFVLKNNGTDVTLPIPRGTILKSLLENPYMQSVEAIKNINDVMNNEKFAKFVNVETGEEYKVSDSINANTTVKAVYYISLTIDGKQYDKIPEDTKLADLYQYAAKKDGYEFVAFTDEEGNAVTDASVVNGAKFVSTYKEIPVEATTETTTVATQTNGTGVANPQTLDNVLTYVILTLVSVMTITFCGYKIVRKVRN